MFAFAIKRGVASPTLVALRRIVPCVRYESSTTPATSAVKNVPNTTPEQMKLIEKFESKEMLEVTKSNQEKMARFEECREIFYGPERDYENYPTPKLRENYPPLRLGIIPGRWFDLMYDKTGVLGPYILGGSFTTYLFSKELIMLDPSLTETIGILFLFAYLSGTKLVNRLSNYFGTVVDAHQEVMYNGPIRKAREFTDSCIEQYNKEIDYMKNEDFVDQVYEENLGLMLEAEYRKRLSEVHSEVKRRLNYQLDLQNTRRRFEQDHMVRWITDSVLKSVTPQLEKDSIKSCIATLNSLAKTSKAV